ncbi:MAG TPA: lytic transglycosylase domain-containing protein, partial [Nitrospiria bacterium]|nr:lytic transglycosylase domain-containing protein [Nitrospiria bacterium]
MKPFIFKSILWISAFFLPGLFPGISLAETYFFVDTEGVVHFTDNPSDHRFRPHGRDSAYVRVDREALNQMILSASRRHSVESALVKAVVKVESDFDPQAVSGAGAMGLMQLMPGTATLLGVNNPFDPFENLSGGTRFLRSLLDRFDNDVTLALAAYHAGPGRVEKHGGVPPIEQTHRYIRKVLSAYSTYQRANAAPRSTFRVDSEEGDIIYTNVPENYR